LNRKKTVNRRSGEMTACKRSVTISAALGILSLSAILVGSAVSAASPMDTPPAGQNCWATHYGPVPDGARTANGERYDGNAMTASTALRRKPQLAFGTKLKVTNVANGKSITVRINDRGHYRWTEAAPKCLELTDTAFSRIGEISPDPVHLVVKTQVVK
jgi:rare lipoprotein A